VRRRFSERNDSPHHPQHLAELVHQRVHFGDFHAAAAQCLSFGENRGQTPVTMSSPESATPETPAKRVFVTTHWSVVLSAREKDSPDSDAARERLCRTYWPPLYHYLRRDGHNPHDAQDLTQEFLSRFLHRDGLDHLKDQRGKFRSFLLTFLKHFLSDQRDHAKAKKRGGGQPLISLDACEAEERDALGPVDGLSPDQLYDRRWARAVMDEAARRLREEYVANGKATLFDALKDIQPGEYGESSYAEIGAKLGLARGTIASAVHRLRKRHREIVREEIAHTITRPEEIEEEIRNLLAVLSQ
jgi:RNA polymerase sigma factor (sigma-70 family)